MSRCKPPRRRLCRTCKDCLDGMCRITKLPIDDTCAGNWCWEKRNVKVNWRKAGKA